MDDGIRLELTVEPSDEGTRLDKWLSETLQDYDYDVSRSQAQSWIKEGYIRTSRPKLKASDSVTAGDVYDVGVPAAEPFDIAPDDIDIDILHEDADVVVVNKPRGLVVHPAAGHERGTLVNALVAKGVRLSQLGGHMRPGVVHRIDKDTSGVLMLAKTDLAYHSLTEQLRDHSVDRVYHAIVHDVVMHDSGIIDAPIGRDPRNRQRNAVTDNGKPAVTHFSVLERFDRYTWLELRLETGRTHQIRVHMAYIGHPLAGDPVYGRRHTLAIDGQALHAELLGFTHPRDGSRLSFQAPLPSDMESLLQGLRTGVL